MDSHDWGRARLIPLTGIRGTTEQETRGTSALLAVISVVPDFSRALLRELGAPAGRPATFTEVSFDDGEGNVLRPDGVIQITRAGTSWTALAEVKTGRNELERQQIESYVRLANREGFDAVVTISNEFVAPSAPHPIELTSRVLRQVHLAHWSWAHVLTTAVILRRRQEVSDPEQAWLLDELSRYLEDERSGALFFEGFGPRWVAIRDAARAGTLRAGDEGLEDFAGRWDQFLRHLGLQLSGQLGTEVSIVTKREHKRDPDKRKRDLLAQLAQEYQLDGTLRVPGPAADIQLSANLRARRVRCSVTLQAPASGRATTRINWLVRQLGGAPKAVQVRRASAGADPRLR